MTTPAKGLGTFDKSTMPTVRPALILALMLTACGGPFEPKAECRVEGFTVYGEGALDCEAVKTHLALARELLTKSSSRTQRMPDLRQLVSPDEFDSIFGGLVIWVHSATRWIDIRSEYGPTTRVRGGYTPEGEIEIGADFYSLVHEMLHHLDGKRGLDRSHEGWVEDGYTYTDGSYKKTIVAQ